MSINKQGCKLSTLVSQTNICWFLPEILGRDAEERNRFLSVCSQVDVLSTLLSPPRISDKWLLLAAARLLHSFSFWRSLTHWQLLNCGVLFLLFSCGLSLSARMTLGGAWHCGMWL